MSYSGYKLRTRSLVIFTVLFSMPWQNIWAQNVRIKDLDHAIEVQGSYLISNIPPNSTLAIVGIASGNEDLSKYITEGLTSYIVNTIANNKNVKIVERAAMPILQKEIAFQYSGMVNDYFMVSLGKMVGANTVIAGTLYSTGNELRFNIRAIDIETSLILASNGIDFRPDQKTRSFLKGKTVRQTLKEENIPVRNNDGSISRANRALQENTRRNITAAKDFTSNLFTKTFRWLTTDIPDREFRWTFGYNYHSDFDFVQSIHGIEAGFLRNGFGVYAGLAMGPGQVIGPYQKSYIIFSLGSSFPLYFDWLWINAGLELFSSDYYGENRPSDPDGGVNYTGGVYLTKGKFYLTVRYRYMPKESQKHGFLIGGGMTVWWE